MKLVFFVFQLLAVLSLGCHKVPLHENPGAFEVLSAHYFESEKTQYIFFAITGLKPEQAKTSWPSRFEIKADNVESAALKVQADGFSLIDYTQAVHRHRLVTCGEDRLCGSMSFKAEKAPEGFAVRFKYHENSPMKIEALVPNSVHKADRTASSQSAIVYGVFNEDNGRLQVRVHNNFGYPNDAELASFGMERRFEVSSVALENFSADEVNAMKDSSGTPLLYPAETCSRDSGSRLAALPGGSAKVIAHIEGSQGWWPNQLDPSENLNSACFKARLLDRNGKPLSESWAMARRNPVLQEESLKVSSPLSESRLVPLVLSYCLNQADSANLTSKSFLEYQLFILGIKGASIDACFAVGQEEQFARELDRVLNEKIASARRTSLDGKDFLLTVAINHRLSPVIVRFHEMIAEAIDRKIHEERILVSPRLVGAFVYDSDALETRSLERLRSENSSSIWCPRALDLAIDNADPTAANCNSLNGGEIELGPINFLIPMGTFPTLRTYVEYAQKYGDKGFSRNPKFAARSLNTNVNSVSGEQGATYTFFDGERVEIEPGQRLRFCRDRDSEKLLSSVVARTVEASGDGAGTKKFFNSNQLNWATLGGSAKTTVEIGLSWEYPFVGGLTYDVPIEGSVFNIIPIQSSTGGSQSIGDLKWTRQSWSIGRVLQKCLKYCDHPFFDEAGVYQSGTSWQMAKYRCPTPKVVEPPSGG